jgi:MFS family permease
MTTLSRTFYALRFRDFRLYWLALAVSLLGSSFQTAAQDWLVYRLTNSPLILGIAVFVPAVLAAPFSLVGGALADRLSRRHLIVFTQASMMLPPLALAWLIASGQIQVWHVVVSSIVLGVLLSIDAPARTALLNDLVNDDDLGNAMGLSTATYQAARVVGPALAGLLISLQNEALPFLINGLSYGAMVLALLLMQTQGTQPAPSLPWEGTWQEGSLPKEEVKAPPSLGASVVEGYRFVWRDATLLGLMILLFLRGLLLMPYLRLMPVVAREGLQTGPETYGLLLSSAGLGALLGGLFVASTRGGQRGRVLTVGTLIAPLVLILFAWSRSLPLAVLTLVCMGISTASLNTLNATLLQLNAPNEMRGRVMGIASIGFLGTTSLGALVLSVIAERSNASVALTSGAALCLVLALAVVVRFRIIRHLA